MTIAIVGQGGSPVANATTSGAWSNGASVAGGCVTDGTGMCTVTRSNLKSNVASVTFTVTDVQHAANVYDPAANVETSDVVCDPY